MKSFFVIQFVENTGGIVAALHILLVHLKNIPDKNLSCLVFFHNAKGANWTRFRPHVLLLFPQNIKISPLAFETTDNKSEDVQKSSETLRALNPSPAALPRSDRGRRVSGRGSPSDNPPAP